MTSAAVLLSLAERAEREEPSRKLDVAIQMAAGGHKVFLPPAPPYTTSLDAAVTLVPEGAEWEMTNLYGIAYADVGLNFNDIASSNCRRNDGNLVMALCAAALRARAALQETRPASDAETRNTPNPSKEPGL